MAADFIDQSPTASESTSQCEVAQLAEHVGELGDEVAKICQSCEVEDIPVESDGLQELLESTASQLLGAVFH